MKKIHHHYLETAGISCLLFLLSFTAPAQDYTEAQRQERCKNNKARIAELEGQLKVVNEDLPQAWQKKEIQDTKNKVTYLESLRTDHDFGEQAEIEVRRIAAHNNFSVDDCAKTAKSIWECIKNLENLLTEKIDKANSLNRPELLSKKNELEKELAERRNRLITLGCEEADAASWEGTYTDDHSELTITGSGSSLSVTWEYTANDAKGNGSWSKIEVDGNKITGKWQAQHEDDTKKGSRKGSFTATLTGKTIEWKLLEDTPSWTYKPGFNEANVVSSMGKDKKWTLNLTKK